MVHLLFADVAPVLKVFVGLGRLNCSSTFHTRTPCIFYAKWMSCIICIIRPHLLLVVSFPSCYMEGYNNSSSKNIIHQTIGNISIEMSCTVEYRGNWAPTMTWKLHADREPFGDNSELGYNKLFELEQVQTKHVMNESVMSTFNINSTSNKSRIRTFYITCTTNFSEKLRPPSSDNSHESENIPNYSYTWTSPSIQIISGESLV